MIASILEREAHTHRLRDEDDLRKRGLTTRELLGLEDRLPFLPTTKRRRLNDVEEQTSHITKPASKRPRHPASRAGVEYNPWNFPDTGAVARFPALQRRNHYSIQEHHATANHYDLRLLCTEAHSPGPCDICGTSHSRSASGRVDGTLSFAVPKGFSGMQPGEKRLAVETPLHPYSIYEGGGVGITRLHDIGIYEILSSKSGRRDKGADTDIEDDSAEVEDDGDIYGGSRGMNHERALAAAYRGSGGSSSCAFIIRLTGERYSLQLAFSHQKANHTHANDRLRGAMTKRKRWFVSLSSSDDGHFLNREVASGPQSVLTGRSMEQIKSDSALVQRRTPSIDEQLSQDDLDDFNIDY